MRRIFLFMTCAASVFLISGCGTAVSAKWQHDAQQRFSNVISVGAETFAPEETDNIRKTISLADRFHHHERYEDADRLYQLSSQKSQLLYRNLVLSKIAHGTVLGLESGENGETEVFEIDRNHVSLDRALRAEQDQGTQELTDNSQPITVDQNDHVVGSTDAAMVHRPIQQYSERAGPASSGNGLRRPNRPGTTIYLTFDDGPSRLTLPIASFLKSEGVAATFFVLGNNIKGREQAVTATVAMGHRVGNHTLSHNLKKLKASLAGGSSEVKKTGDMVERLGGDGRMVRIPYGAAGKAIVTGVAAEGAQIFDWDINSNDSTQRGVRDHRYIERTVLSQLSRSPKKHIILLFHDGSGHDATLTALRDLIPRLKREGYRFGLLARSEKVAHSTVQQRTVQ